MFSPGSNETSLTHFSTRSFRFRAWFSSNEECSLKFNKLNSWCFRVSEVVVVFAPRTQHPNSRSVNISTDLVTVATTFSQCNFLDRNAIEVILLLNYASTYYVQQLITHKQIGQTNYNECCFKIDHPFALFLYSHVSTINRPQTNVYTNLQIVNNYKNYIGITRNAPFESNYFRKTVFCYIVKIQLLR